MSSGENVVVSFKNDMEEHLKQRVIEFKPRKGAMFSATASTATEQSHVGG